jgi:hypothetical protein
MKCGKVWLGISTSTLLLLQIFPCNSYISFQLDYCRKLEETTQQITFAPLNVWMRLRLHNGTSYRPRPSHRGVFGTHRHADSS